MSQFIITNGKSYIMQGACNALTGTNDINKALKFPSYTKAINACNNLPRSLKNIGYYVEEAKMESPCISAVEPKPITERIDTLDPRIISTHTPVEFVDEIGDFDCIADFMAQFDDMVYNTLSLDDSLHAKLDDIEREIVDIEHAIEFYSVDACKGYKMYKLLRDARLERRKIKNSLLFITILRSSLSETYATTDFTARLEGMANRKYRIRNNNTLFKESE